jgi:hypothetical protein
VTLVLLEWLGSQEDDELVFWPPTVEVEKLVARKSAGLQGMWL